jgi:Fe2+ or Zn2+ uptake regulation protein
MGSASPTVDLVDDALRRLRAAGGRITSSRRAVLEALVTSPHHPDAETLATAARRIDPNVHLATVYRTLDTLEQLGVISHVHLGHGRSTYHLCSDLHHHAVCNGCGAVTELDGAPMRRLADAVLATHGFVVDTYHFALVGTCARCAAS